MPRFVRFYAVKKNGLCTNNWASLLPVIDGVIKAHPRLLQDTATIEPQVLHGKAEAENDRDDAHTLRSRLFGGLRALNMDGTRSPFVLATIGPAGTYSEAAAREYARLRGINCAMIRFAPTWECLALTSGNLTTLAVLPAENLVDGLIGMTYDALVEFKDQILVVDELTLPIHHVLAARTPMLPAQIKAIYSHPSALNQCARRLAGLAPSAEVTPVGSTAEAAVRVLNTVGPVAAICSPEAAASLRLCVIEEELADYPENQTRFFICGSEAGHPSARDRTLIAVRFGRNQPGQLYGVARAFAARDVDLSSVHSRPYQARPREYVLFFELVGHRDDPGVIAALTEISEQVDESGGWLWVIGSFPRQGMVQS